MTSPADAPPRRLIVALTGATGTIFGVRLLETLKETDVETHLVMSKWAARTLLHETSYTIEQVQRLSRLGGIVGTAFQISDDIIDIDSDSHESGKAPGTDLTALH